MIEAGANAIVSGSGVFNQPNYAEAIQGIRNSKRPELAAAGSNDSIHKSKRGPKAPFFMPN